MPARVSADWQTCNQVGCIGIPIDVGGRCIAHAGDEEQAAALKQLAHTGKIDVRGVTISSSLLEKIFDSVPRNLDRTALLKEARFDNAVFQADARFEYVTFQGPAWFTGATFQGYAGFSHATFQDTAAFDEVTFHGSAAFNEMTFQDRTWFTGATFRDGAIFLLATFQYDVMFDRASFQGPTGFTRAAFQGEAWFHETTFHRTASFTNAAFSQTRKLGPLLAHRGLVLDEVQFSQPVQIEASAIGICCRRAQFQGGVQFRLRWARVILDDTDFSKPSLLIGIPRLTSDAMALPERCIARAWKRLLADQISEQPRVLSLRRANVAGLGLGNVNLADCRFTGAHNLDKLRLESDVAFRLSPARIGWERRQVLAEESAWRAATARSSWWAEPSWPNWPDWDDSPKPAVVNPATIAGLYRALRKAREDAKDEPGAADFYYGEMEMRRHASQWSGHGDGGPRGLVEHSVLTAYWSVSGYGLRAGRALGWLTAITVAFALAFHLVGFTHPPEPGSYWTSLLYAFRSTLSLSDNGVILTAWGQLLQALLRLTGPVLLGLALLALRGRVKR